MLIMDINHHQTVIGSDIQRKAIFTRIASNPHFEVQRAPERAAHPCAIFWVQWHKGKYGLSVLGESLQSEDARVETANKRTKGLFIITMFGMQDLPRI